jgi:hypothetical protein
MRMRAVVVAFFALAAMLPSRASAQIEPTSESCAQILLPEDISTVEIEDLLFNGMLCPGERLVIESEESSLKIDSPELEEVRKDSEVNVQLPQPVGSGSTRTVAPEVADLEELAKRLGAGISREETTVVMKTPDSRYEKHTEKTEIEGENFQYKSKESREEIEKPDFKSDSRDREEEFRARG